MPYRDLQEFVAGLERAGELKRVRVEVDPELEITEIAMRQVLQSGPALLFENVKGSRYPLLINAFASQKRIEMAIGRPPAEIGEQIIGFIERLNPPSLKTLVRERKTLRLLTAARLKNVGRAIAQEVVEQPDLDALPVLKCWPDDGGRFFTFSPSLTHHPVNHRSNFGLYRLQIFDKATTGMHWQLGKGGGYHYFEAEQEGKPLEVAVVVGGDPALMLSAILPLPEALEEIVFSGLLRGNPLPMVQAKSLFMRVPANAEFILEGKVLPGERRMEGPFGDHFGHYSNAAPFPVFHINTVTRRKNPIYPATVVGKPPQEDRWMGDAAQEFLNPFLKLIRPEVADLWAYYEAGFHNLLVVSVKSRFAKEPLKTALGLFGEGQLSLTKCIVLVGPGVNPRDFTAVLREVRKHFNAGNDFLLLPRVPLDTLDFTSFKMHLGSKMALDATPKGDENGGSWPFEGLGSIDMKRLAPEASDWRLLEDTLLAVKVPEGAGKRVAERIASVPELKGLKMVAAVSNDIDLKDQTSLLWGIFTRFDPARDAFFPEMRFEGAAPLYRGPLAIDATWKPGYPAPLVMDSAIVDKVNKRWNEY